MPSAEPGYREVPAFDGPPEYEPDDDWQEAYAELQYESGMAADLEDDDDPHT